MSNRSFHGFIEKHLSKGKTILELGSGSGSLRLVECGYVVYSVEHNADWVDRYEGVNYIYSPLRKHKDIKGFECQVWYHPDYLRELPDYDLLLIDGPPAWSGRAGFMKYLSLFDTEVPMVFDDVNRKNERLLIQKVAQRLGRSYYVDTRVPQTTTFGVILPSDWEWEPVRG